MRIGTSSAAAARRLPAAMTALSNTATMPALLPPLLTRSIQLIAASINLRRQRERRRFATAAASFNSAYTTVTHAGEAVRSMAAELPHGRLVAVLLPPLVSRVVDHRADEVVGVDHPARLRSYRHVGGRDRLLIGDLEAQRRADRRRVGLMDRDIDLRLDVLIVEDRIAHAVGGLTEADDRAELDVRRRQRVHDLEEMRAHRRRRQTRIGAGAFLQRPRRVVPDEGEVVIAAQNELIEQADRAAGAAWYGAEAGRRQIFLPGNRCGARGQAGEPRIERAFARIGI